MEKTASAVALLTVILAAVCLIIAFIKPSEGCGDGACGSWENWKNCPSDCAPIETHTECQNQLCTTVDGEGTNECSSNAECASVTESHFGVHLGSAESSYSSANNFVRELDENIFVRIGFVDTYGWKQVKNSNQDQISKCQACCNAEKTGSACTCTSGFKYYCEPASRAGLFNVNPSFMDYYNNFNPFIGFVIGRYDNIAPKILTGDYPIGNEDVYRDYLKYVVQNAPKAKYWVVGNENDYSLFWAGTPEDYANLVKISYEEIKQNCPDCKVGISFTNSIPSNEGYYFAMGNVCNYFDFIDAHYYQPSLITLTALDRWKTTCPGKEFISTETGIPDSVISWKGRIQTIGGTPEKQAEDLIKLNTLMFYVGYNKIYWYLIDTHYLTSVPPEQDTYMFNALLNEDYTKKPAFNTYRLMINKVDYFTSITKLNNGQYRYSFSNKNPVYVLWCESGSCSSPAEISGTVKVTDYLGNEETKQASSIVLNESPVFVE